MKRFTTFLLAAVAGAALLSGAARAQINAQTGTSYTVLNTDCDPDGKKVVTFSNASAVAVTLPQAGASGAFKGGCSIKAVNLGVGTVTITPTTSTISGNTTLALSTNASAEIVSTATPAGTGNYVALGGGSVTSATYYFTGTPAATDTAFFLATRSYRVVAASEVHSVAAGGASVLQLVKDTGTSAPGAGTDLLTNNTNTGFDLNATANTPQVGALSATAADLRLAAGDRLSVDFANAIQSSAGVLVTVSLAPF